MSGVRGVAIGTEASGMKSLFFYPGPDAVDPPYGKAPERFAAPPAPVVVDWTEADSQVDE